MKKPRKKVMTVVEVIEKDRDRILFAGLYHGKRKTFHLRRDPGGYVDEIVTRVEMGQTVKVEI